MLLLCCSFRHCQTYVDVLIESDTISVTISVDILITGIQKVLVFQAQVALSLKCFEGIFVDCNVFLVFSFVPHNPKTSMYNFIFVHYCFLKMQCRLYCELKHEYMLYNVPHYRPAA